MTVEYRPLPFDEAIELFRGKVVLTRAQYDQLADEVKIRAFTVARIAEADIILDVYGAVERALVEGLSFEAFQETLDLAALGWVGESPHRLDTIFRTNIMTMYQAGHYRQQMEVVAERPYWQYVATMDIRTRPLHARMHGIVLPANHDFWNRNYPPNGFNCRCTVISLSDREVERDRVEVSQRAMPDIADPGFAYNPGLAAWEPDLSKYPPWLREQIGL